MEEEVSNVRGSKMSRRNLTAYLVSRWMEALPQSSSICREDGRKESVRDVCVGVCECLPFSFAAAFPSASLLCSCCSPLVLPFSFSHTQPVGEGCGCKRREEGKELAAGAEERGRGKGSSKGEGKQELENKSDSSVVSLFSSFPFASSVKPRQDSTGGGGRLQGGWAAGKTAGCPRHPAVPCRG